MLLPDTGPFGESFSASFKRRPLKGLWKRVEEKKYCFGVFAFQGCGFFSRLCSGRGKATLLAPSPEERCAAGRALNQLHRTLCVLLIRPLSRKGRRS